MVNTSIMKKMTTWQNILSTLTRSKTVPEEKAVKELGLFGNQNSVCKPRNKKWEFTIEQLKKYWKNGDKYRHASDS